MSIWSDEVVTMQDRARALLEDACLRRELIWSFNIVHMVAIYCLNSVVSLRDDDDEANFCHAPYAQSCNLCQRRFD